MVMKARGTRDEEARRKAQEQFNKVKQRDADALKDREKAEQAGAAKVARLRALRLAKEALDRQEAAAQPKIPVAARKRSAE